jgi:hypothetical protein
VVLDREADEAIGARDLPLENLVTRHTRLALAHVLHTGETGEALGPAQGEQGQDHRGEGRA